MSIDKLIFFHVGTGKTGTTFLQDKVFPKMEETQFVPLGKYKKFHQWINKNPRKRYLVSREFDRQFDQEIEWFASYASNVQPIIVFRRHDSYIASQFRRFVKNGWVDSFERFFDVEKDEGFFKQIHLSYQYQIERLKEVFGKDPIVFLYDDLKKDDVAYISNFIEKVEGKIAMNSINLSAHHSSYKLKQLRAMIWLGKYLNMKKRSVSNHKAVDRLWKISFGAFKYSFLFFANLMPDSFFSKEPLISSTQLQKVADFYRADWEFVEKEARKYR